jgi:tetratricopeptide (TPR) repeat protein
MDWKDNQTLFSNDYFHSSNSAKLNSSLGFTLLDNYRNLDDKDNNKYLITQAIFHLKKAIEIYPKYIDCYFLLGNAYYLNKDYKNAVIIYEKYIELNPNDHTILKNYEKALREYGRILFFEENNNLAAKNQLLKALKLEPNDDKALEILGAAEAELGYLVNSLQFLLKSAEINPNSASTWANLYITYTRLGDKAKAQVAINKGMEIDKDVVKKLMSVRTH